MQQFINFIANKQRSSTTENALSALVIVIAAFGVGWLLRFSRYGYDFTDEGFYLNWISHPFNYPISSTQFGFIYHPLYLAVGGDIALLRQANVLLTFGLALAAGWILLGNVFGGRALSRASRLAVSAAMATSAPLAFVFAGMWLPTPSYNSLTFQGLLVALIGLLLAEKELSRASIFGWILIAVGGWLTFMAKPTSAAVLAMVSGTYVLLAGKFRVAPLAITLGSTFGLLLLSALAVDGSVLAFVERLNAGVEEGKTLASGSNYTFDTMFRLDDLLLTEDTKLLLCFVSAIAFFAVWFARVQTGYIGVVSQILSVVLATIGFLILFQFIPPQSILGQHRGLVLFAVPCGAALAGLTIYRFKGLRQISVSQWALVLVLLILPYAYAFGTANNYWVPIACTGVFIVLAGYLLLGPIVPQQTVPKVLLTVGLSVQVVSMVLLASGLASPYRQSQPLSRNDSVVEVGKPRSILILAKSPADYLHSAKEIARQAGFTQGSPMIDLTGRSPGLIYALMADSVGLAWAIGGYQGSNQLVIDGLRQVPCGQLAAAWILSEPDGPRAISPQVLSSIGANIETDFEMVGSLISPEGKAQHMLRPVRAIDSAIAACGAIRAKSL